MSSRSNIDLVMSSHRDERLLGENFLELKELEIDFDLSITGFTLPEIEAVPAHGEVEKYFSTTSAVRCPNEGTW